MYPPLWSSRRLSLSNRFNLISLSLSLQAISSYWLSMRSFLKLLLRAGERRSDYTATGQILPSLSRENQKEPSSYKWVLSVSSFTKSLHVLRQVGWDTCFLDIKVSFFPGWALWRMTYIENISRTLDANTSRGPYAFLDACLDRTSVRSISRNRGRDTASPPYETSDV